MAYVPAFSISSAVEISIYASEKHKRLGEICTTLGEKMKRGFIIADQEELKYFKMRARAPNMMSTWTIYIRLQIYSFELFPHLAGRLARLPRNLISRFKAVRQRKVLNKKLLPSSSTCCLITKQKPVMVHFVFLHAKCNELFIHLSTMLNQCWLHYQAVNFPRKSQCQLQELKLQVSLVYVSLLSVHWLYLRRS